MLKRYSLVVITILILSLISGCAAKHNTPTSTPSKEKIQVVATFYPMAYLSQRIGGDKIQLSTLIPPGVEPHDWEPSPKTVARLNDAQLLVANGLGMEPWLASIAQTAPNIKVLKTAEGITSVQSKDPHIWLDPLAYKEMAIKVATTLKTVDPANAAYYDSNTEHLSKDLEALHKQFVDTLSNTKSRDFVVSHEAFGYLASRYQLHQVSLRGLDPDAEPTPAKLAKTIEFCKAKKIKYIFFEELVNPKLSKILATEVGAQTLSLNPLESLTDKEVTDNKDYISVMQANLANLKRALQ